MVFTILKRVAALVILKVSGVLAAGSIVGVELWQSAIVASFVGVMEVSEELARGYLADGRIDDADIDAAFKKAGDDS